MSDLTGSSTGAGSAIVGFRQDDQGHWIADLRCGHSQHVRHDPPWQVRPWVEQPDARARFIGIELPCLACRREGTASQQPPRTS